jgi:cytochrome oxidase Cu insertion factor (SCO1/SenC/PrrC family)
MKNIIERCRQIRSVARIRTLVVVAVFLTFCISPGLTIAATLGPADGDGFAPTDLERVKVGDPAPDFTLEAENGTPITLSQFRGKNSVILVFYRGHW